MKLAAFLLANLLAISSCIGTNDSAVYDSNRYSDDVATLQDRPIIYLGFEGSSESWLAHETYTGLAEHLTAHTSYRFQITLGKNSEEVVGFLEERYVDVALLGVVSYLEAHKEFGALPLVKPLNKEGQPLARSAFITREDRPISKLSDLRDASMALASPHSTLGNLLPRHEIMNAGFPIEKLKRLENLSYHEEVVQAVVDGRFDAGAVKDTIAQQHVSSDLRLFHLSEPIPTSPIVVRPDLPRSVAESITAALLLLDYDGKQTRTHWNESIRYGFVRAVDDDYGQVREMLGRHFTGCGGRCHSDVRF